MFSSNTFSYVGVARADARRRRAIEVMSRARPGASVGARAREAVRMTTSTETRCAASHVFFDSSSSTSTDGTVVDGERAIGERHRDDARFPSAARGSRARVHCCLVLNLIVERLSRTR